MTIYFDEARRIAISVAEELESNGGRVTIVRDLVGRCRLVPDDRYFAWPEGTVAEAAQQMTDRLGVYCGDPPVLLASELFDVEGVLQDPHAVAIGSGNVQFVERSVTGASWTAVESSIREAKPITMVMYSLKGGVGRSTASVFLARALAAEGRSVLLVDLDLESPGLSSLAVDSLALPDYGIVDILAEAAVGQSIAENAVVRCPVLEASGAGQVWLCPAAGRPREGYTYLPKLNRAYLDVAVPGTPDSVSFGYRLESAISEAVVSVASSASPVDVVLVDSRAGMHDIAGECLTRLADVGLLFAANTPQTWWGYQSMFGQWSERPAVAKAVRERLKVVAAMVDKVAAGEYLRSFIDQAAECFSSLYDYAEAGDTEAFNFDVLDPAAPHSPLPIYFDSDLRHLTLERVMGLDKDSPVLAAYDQFTSGVIEILEEFA